jgi:hypothetical protein
MSRPSTPHARLAGLLRAGACLALAATSIACGDPVIDAQIEALGGEAEGVEPGQYHRPGQPCALCHAEYPGQEPFMAVAGTVFADPVSFLPVEGAEVIIYDAVGQIFRKTTNCIGNFHWTRDEADVQFPIAVEVRCPTYDADGAPKTDPTGKTIFKVKAMGSWVSRDRSCAGCHSLTGRTLDSTGWIYCNTEQEAATNPYPAIPEDCPGKPPREKGASSE